MKKVAKKNFFIEKTPVEKAIQIGKDAAESAFDQAGEWGSLQNSIDTYFENVQDTLSEQNIFTEETFAAACKAFDATVSALRAGMTK